MDLSRFCAARDNTMPTLLWPSIAPPFTDGLVRTENAVTTCILLLQGQGFFIADPDDPRVLGFDSAQIRPPYDVAMPQGVDPCSWLMLIEAAPVEDVRVIVSFDMVVDGDLKLPTLPPFIKSELSPTLLGLSEDAAKLEIAQRFSSLYGTIGQAQADAGKKIQAPIAVAHANAAVQAAETARELLETIRRLGTN